MATVRNMEGGRWDRNRILTLLAATLLLAVVAYWGVTLSAVAPTAAASETHAEATARPLFDAVASLPLVRLLSPGAVQTEVVVLGVMAGDHAPLALLSVDGRPAEAYAPGQRLGPCTVLASISANAVELNQAGRSRRLPVPELPPVPSDGIVPAAP
ncbi:general secretion pathway protein [Stenotrophomonas pavanii]|uniref:General secretion pathway protein n=2 Tax=Lysobacteraceae TaxID=32033 RepID=A0ABM7R7D6_9GAMM|nr:general secretion pathway protein [Stenotrophomonas pavanii]